MSRISDYAQTLAALYRQRKDRQVALSHLEADAEARKKYLVPAGGWLSDQPKATVDQRKQACETACFNDEVLKAIALKTGELRDALADVEAEILALEELASAERWAIREKIAQALLARFGGERLAEDAAPSAPEFDQSAQGAADEALPF